MLSFLLLYVLAVLKISQQINITTDPGTIEDQTLYIPVQEEETDYTLVCVVNDTDSSVQQVTEWHIQRSTVESDITAITVSPSDGTIIAPSDLANSVAITGVLVPGSPTITYRTNFTILNFTAQFDTTTLQCGQGQTRRTFVLGFPGLFRIK